MCINVFLKIAETMYPPTDYRWQFRKMAFSRHTSITLVVQIAAYVLLMSVSIQRITFSTYNPTKKNKSVTCYKIFKNAWPVLSLSLVIMNLCIPL